MFSSIYIEPTAPFIISASVFWLIKISYLIIFILMSKLAPQYLRGSPWMHQSNIRIFLCIIKIEHFLPCFLHSHSSKPPFRNLRRTYSRPRYHLLNSSLIWAVITLSGLGLLETVLVARVGEWRSCVEWASTNFFARYPTKILDQEFSVAFSVISRVKNCWFEINLFKFV